MKKKPSKKLPAKKVVAKKKAPAKPAHKPPKAKRTIKITAVTPDADEEIGLSAAPETTPTPKAERHPISNYPDRPLLEKYFGLGEKSVLPEDAQISCLEKCDPQHPRYDKLFAEITLRQARPKPAKIEFKPFQVPLEDGYDPQTIQDPSVEGDFTLIADSPGYSLYQHANKKLRIVNAKTRACNEWQREGGEPIPPLDNKKGWEAVVAA